MGDQQTFASVAWSARGKVTRRERFLAETDAVLKLIEPHYPKAGNGRQPLGLEKMCASTDALCRASLGKLCIASLCGD